MIERTETRLLDDFVNHPAERGDLPNRPTTRPLPAGWTKSTLGNIATLVGGGTPSRNVPEYFGGKIVWLTPTEIPKNGVTTIADSKEKLTELGLRKSSAKLLPKGTVLLTSRASIGYVAITGTEVSTNQGFASFICKDGVYNFYLGYWLKANVGLLESEATGTTFKEISKSKLRELEIAFPILSEQERIVAEIEKQFTRLDQAVVSLRRLQTNLARYKASVLKAACEGRLVPQDPTDEPAETLLQRILSERRTQWQTTHPGKKYEERGRVITSELPNLPDDWITVTLADILADIQTGPFGSSLHKSDYVVGGIPVINPASILDGKIRPMGEMAIDNATRERLSQFILKEGDVIMGRRGEMGRSAMVTEKEAGWLCGTGSLILRFAQDVSRKYIVYLFSSESTKAYLGNASVGTTMQNLNQKILLNMTIGLPPLAEQHRIVAEVERRLSVITTLEQTLTTNLARAERLRQSILHRAFTGQLV